MIRLYFNKHGKKPWSIDRGAGTLEEQFAEIHFAGDLCKTVYDPSAGDNENTPTAWIEIDDTAGFGLIP